MTDPNIICQTLNEYFANIGPQLANHIPKHYHDNYHHTMLRTTISSSSISSFKPCSEKETLDIINKLDSNCSVGVDDISTKAVKSVKHLIRNKLTNCINKLLCGGILPESLIN